VAAATAGSTAAVVVDYIGLALQLSAFDIVFTVLALVLFDSPSPPPSVSAGVFVVLPPALLPTAPGLPGFAPPSPSALLFSFTIFARAMHLLTPIKLRT
jgi:hypothetical protein